MLSTRLNFATTYNTGPAQVRCTYDWVRRGTNCRCVHTSLYVIAQFSKAYLRIAACVYAALSVIANSPNRYKKRHGRTILHLENRCYPCV